MTKDHSLNNLISRYSHGHYVTSRYIARVGEVEFSTLRQLKVLIFLHLLFIWPPSLKGDDLHNSFHGYGPLQLRSQSPGQLITTTSPLRDARLMRESDPMSFKSAAGISNFWAKSKEYVYDFELLNVSTQVEKGIFPRWNIGVAFNHKEITNVYLDQAVINFHKLIRIGLDGREEAPKNATRLEIYSDEVDEGGELTPTVISRTIDFTVGRNLIDGGRSNPSISLFGTVNYETYQGPLKNTTKDLTTQFALSYPFFSSISYLNLSYSFFDPQKVNELPILAGCWSFAYAHELLMKARQSVLLHYIVSGPALKDMGQLSLDSHEVHLGYKTLFQNIVWEIGVVENVVRFYNGPDVGFFLGLTTQL